MSELEKEIVAMKAKIKEVEDGLIAIGKKTYEFGESIYCDEFHKSPSDATWNQLNQQLILLRQERLAIAASSAAQPAQGEFYLLILVFAVFPYMFVSS